VEIVVLEVVSEMNTPKKEFRDFWAEVGRPFITGCAKTAIFFPPAIILAIVTTRLLQCGGLIGDNAQKAIACAEVLTPAVLLSHMLAFLPTLFTGTLVGLPPLFLCIFSLEWSKYKKDAPSGFVYDKFWNEGSRGVTTRKSELMVDVLTMGDVAVPAVESKNGFRRFEGAFSDEQFQKFLRSYIGWWNKPVEKAEGEEKWRILIRNGSEIHIALQRKPSAPSTWVMTTEFYEWAGRKQPHTLVETFVTEFVATLAG
jgi:hypothetical protein